ncbi:MAG: hypothetical protein ACRDXB_15890 [Actinomycetes bacterium]
MAIIIAVLVAFSGAAAQFGAFLGVIGIVVPPFAGVLMAHFWLVARGVSGARLLSEAPTVRWEALGCWLVSALLAWSTGFLLTDAIEGLVAGAVLYGIVGSLLRARQTPATSVSGA